MSSTLSIQKLIDPLSTYPEVQLFNSTGGFGSQPALSFANDVLSRMLAQPFNWKWNRAYVPTFLTVSLQQDYVTNVTDMGWLEQAWRLDINNTVTPKPYFTMESVRDLGQTSFQANPFNISYIPNALATMGSWQANTAYGCGYGQASVPASPIQQFIDANGNILFINSNSLGLSLNSPGYSGTPISTTPPFGTSGGTKPVLAAKSAAGTTVVDGTVTWTVADPAGVAMRLAPLPAFSGLCWLITAVYQKAPPLKTALTNIITPVPDDLAYLYRQGILAQAYKASPEPGANRKAPAAYNEWLVDLTTALRGADREREDAVVYPSESLTGAGPFQTGFPLGPAYPFSPYGF